MPTVGIIKPSTRPGKAEELVAILPKEVELLHSGINIDRGTLQELVRGLFEYEERVAEMAEQGADLIHPAGVPPLLLGYKGERALVDRWEKQHKRPVFTNGMSQVNALRAFKAKRIVGAGYFPGDINKTFGQYLTEAGFEVLDMVGMDVNFRVVPRVSAAAIYHFIQALFYRHHDVDAIYLLGPAWRATLGMIEQMESDFGVPVIHHVPAQSWEIQKRFGLRQPFQGHGRLMREMP
jgi:maleate cis-trans isomerase